MEDNDVAIGAEVDVRSIMADVQAEVARKREAGLYPPEVLVDFDASTATPGYDALANALQAVRQSVGFSTAITTASQKGVVAPIASSFKKAVRGSVRWYVAGVMQQVERFSGNVAYLSGLVVDRLRRLEDRLDAELGAHDQRIASIDGDLHAFQASLDATRESLDAASHRVDELETVRARDRLAHVERAIRDLRSRIDGPSVRASADRSPDAPRAPSEEADVSIDYLDFEDRFRGSVEEIRERQREYVEAFRGVPGPVVDLGCGRGEFLELLREGGVTSYGVDRNAEMVALCHEKGLDVRDEDVLDHLGALAAGSLGGIFCAQTIEHLPIRDVPRFFELAADAIAPEGRLVVETLNPESLIVFASAFYVDLGHLRPLHPLTLRFLAEKAGFRDVTIEYKSLPSEELRAKTIGPVGDASVDRVVEEVNENFGRFDRIVFGPQDYAIVATR